MLTIELARNPDGSVTGRMPDGRLVTWARDHSSRPDRRYRHVMVNCYRYRIIWT
jgi:hypothetical protein